MKIKNIGVNIIIREEKMGNRKVFIVNNERIGISDFGDSLDEAIGNFKKALKLYLEVCPEKKKLLIEEEKRPIMISRVNL